MRWCISTLSGAQGAQGLSLPELRPGILGVAAEGRQQLRPGDAGKAQVVVHPFRFPEGTKNFVAKTPIKFTRTVIG